jgi:hypothetical protein
LVNENTTVVDILANLIQLSQLPEYVIPMLVRQAASTFRTTNQTIPQQQTYDDDIQHDRSDDILYYPIHQQTMTSEFH